LKIESRNYQYFLSGEEQDKRKLIGYIVTHNSYGYFTSTETLEKLFPNFNIQESMETLYSTCHNSQLFLNNFALNNLLVHLLIIILRLDLKYNLVSSNSNHKTEKLLEPFEQKCEIIKLADDISSIFENTYKQKIPQEDYNQIIILIALSIDHEYSHIENIVEEDFARTIQKLINQLSRRYNIDDFDSDFVMQFSLHMYNARQRSSFRLSYPNPIASQIKKDYAPIYDMAVYFAHEFSTLYKINLSEDEIAFIAFHIGSYLENHDSKSKNITAIVLVENYHDFSKDLISNIQSSFDKEMIIIDVLPLDKYMITKPKCDLIITTVPINIEHKHVILVNPILTKQNTIKIFGELEKIEDENRLVQAHEFLKNLLHPELYFKNIKLNDKSEYIEFMGDKCLNHHYIKPEFVNDVLLRESVSSTAFTDCLAIPHAISQFADKSFICVVHNDTPIIWGNKNINFILMIGITEKDMKYFRNAFDLIIDLFYSTDRTLELLNTTNFEEFCNRMQKIKA
ncbi:MAG: PTS sugar transporter subunit IIA, partial [Coprobacillus sp.]